MNTLLEVGSQAPDFTLVKGDDGVANGKPNSFTLSDHKNKNHVILTFYPADWSPVCSSEIALYNELRDTFKELGAIVVGISTDGLFCHSAFRENRNLSIDLLSDFHPQGKVSKMYHAFHDEQGTSRRANYIVGKDGMIKYAYLSPDNENPGAKELLDTLKALQ